MNWSSLFTALGFILLALYLWSRSFRSKNFPPGPQGLPFVGNILSFGSRPHITMLEWKEKYGDVYSIFYGKKPMVILNDFHTVRKVFADDATAGRDPETKIRIDASTFADSGLVFTEGDLWKTHRRFALSTLRDLGMGKNWLEETIVTEVEALCQILRKTNQEAFNPKVHLTNSVSNVICALIWGKQFSLTDPSFSRLTTYITEYVEIIAVDSIALGLPFLMWFPNTVRSRIVQARRNLRSLSDFLKKRIKEHDIIEDRQAEVQDYLHAYQKEKESGSKTSDRDTFTDEQLMASLLDLFVAGTETTSTTTLWAMVFMIENPDVLRKVQEEIDNNVGREKMLTNSERVLLPYTEAVILEIQRCASLVPLGVPHRNREDITVNGFTIPKGTVISANLFSIHRDARWWKNPEKFDPNRFLDENMKLTRPDGFMPFSTGKRVCPGEALAKMEMFMFIGNLLRCFDLQLPEGKTLTREDYSSGIVNSPNPFQLIFVPRI